MVRDCNAGLFPPKGLEIGKYEETCYATKPTKYKKDIHFISFNIWNIPTAIK